LTPKERKRKILELKLKERLREREKLRLINEQAKIDNALQAYTPYWYQAKISEYFRAGANVVNVPLSNKTGKSRAAAAIVHSWAKGYEPWNLVPDTYVGAVRVGDKFYMPSSLGKKPPVDIRITGEDWEEHLKKTLVPELKHFAVAGEWETSKNNSGVEASWKHKNGSVFALMTYKQDIGSFESFKGNAWWADEPPPKPIWSAMSRALFMTGGKVLMTMTPLKEAWIWDEVINSNRLDVKTITGITLWDCPHLYDHDMSILMKCGFLKDEAEQWFIMQKAEARLTKNLPESEKVLKEKISKNTVTFLTEFKQELTQDAVTYAMQNLQIHRFIKDLEDDNERIPRVFGEPKYLMGRVWSEFGDKHIINDYKVPPDWPVIFEIDFHMNKPHAISFIAQNKYGQHFVIDEVWQNMNNHAIADEIIRRKLTMGWNIRYGEIDALSKGDDKYTLNLLGERESAFTVIKNKLDEFDIELGVGSKDESSYVTTVRSWLTGINGEMPLLFVFRSCKETIRQMQRWVYINEKPSSDGHFPECIGRASQVRFDVFTQSQARSKAPTDMRAYY
jgi:hypothetical protein